MPEGGCGVLFPEGAGLWVVTAVLLDSIFSLLAAGDSELPPTTCLLPVRGGSRVTDAVLTTLYCSIKKSQHAVLRSHIALRYHKQNKTFRSCEYVNINENITNIKIYFQSVNMCVSACVCV